MARSVGSRSTSMETDTNAIRKENLAPNIVEIYDVYRGVHTYLSEPRAGRPQPPQSVPHPPDPNGCCLTHLHRLKSGGGDVQRIPGSTLVKKSNDYPISAEHEMLWRFHPDPAINQGPGYYVGGIEALISDPLFLYEIIRETIQVVLNRPLNKGDETCLGINVGREAGASQYRLHSQRLVSHTSEAELPSQQAWQERLKVQTAMGHNLYEDPEILIQIPTAPNGKYQIEISLLKCFHFDELDPDSNALKKAVIAVYFAVLKLRELGIQNLNLVVLSSPVGTKAWPVTIALVPRQGRAALFEISGYLTGRIRSVVDVPITRQLEVYRQVNWHALDQAIKTFDWEHPEPLIDAAA